MTSMTTPATLVLASGVKAGDRITEVPADHGSLVLGGPVDVSAVGPDDVFTVVSRTARRIRYTTPDLEGMVFDFPVYKGSVVALYA